MPSLKTYSVAPGGTSAWPSSKSMSSRVPIGMARQRSSSTRSPSSITAGGWPPLEYRSNRALFCKTPYHMVKYRLLCFSIRKTLLSAAMTLPGSRKSTSIRVRPVSAFMALTDSSAEPTPWLQTSRRKMAT